jgi:hypothetical protein
MRALLIVNCAKRDPIWNARTIRWHDWNEITVLIILSCPTIVHATQRQQNFITNTSLALHESLARDSACPATHLDDKIEYLRTTW